MARTRPHATGLHDLLQSLTAPPCLPPPGPANIEVDVLTAIGQLVRCDVAGFNDLAPPLRREWAQSNTLPDDFVPARSYGDELDFWDVYPTSSCSYPDRTGDYESVTTTSDFHSLREWRQTPMYLCLRQELAFDREIQLPLPGPPGHFRRILLIRIEGRDFDDNDRAILALLRPHILAYLHAQDLAGRGSAPLTTRQRQLMALVARGFSNAQLARSLGISSDTVRTHLQQIYARLGVNSRGEAVALISPPSAPSVTRFEPAMSAI